MGRSPRFGSVQRNSTPISDSLSLRLRLSALTLLHRTTRRLIKQKAHRHTFPLRGIVLRLLVGIRFQVLFHSPHRGSFTFPSRYWCTIGHQVVFSLGRWSSQIPTRFLGPRSTQDLHSTSRKSFIYGAITRYGRPFQAVRLFFWLVTRRRHRIAA